MFIGGIVMALQWPILWAGDTPQIEVTTIMNQHAGGSDVVDVLAVDLQIVDVVQAGTPDRSHNRRERPR